MEDTRCKHGMIITYIKADGSTLDSPCPECAKLLKSETRTHHAHLTDDDFKRMTIDAAYEALLLHVLENAFIKVRIASATIEARFDYVYSEIKGHLPDREVAGYWPIEYCENNWGVSGYIEIPITDEIGPDDFPKIPLKIVDNKMIIADTKWIYALFEMGFDLGRNHDVDSVLEYIENNRV